MHVVILAAGKGTRMGLNTSKVLAPLAGKTMIEHLVTSVIDSGVDDCPIIVIGYKGDQVRNALKGYSVTFVEQSEQLGTGHAVSVCKDVIDMSKDVLVLYGDHPLVSSATIAELANQFNESMSPVCMITYHVDSFEEHGGTFTRFGKILRDDADCVIGIREVKDASLEELEITEINPGYYAFSGPWLWQSVEGLKNENAQNEYYLTDLIEMAVKEGEMVDTVLGKQIIEALGINTQEQLAYAEELLTT